METLKEKQKKGKIPNSKKFQNFKKSKKQKIQK